jgi:nickel transport protein
MLVPILMLATSGAVWAHGVSSEILKKDALVIVAEYDDGEPMSYCEVKIFFSTGEGKQHQNGRTDRNGCFAFIPDRPGEWRITVEDGMGHAIDTSFSVNETFGVDKQERVARAPSRWQGIVSGLSVIFGLTGLFYYFRARKLRPGSM